MATTSMNGSPKNVKISDDDLMVVYGKILEIQVEHHQDDYQGKIIAEFLDSQGYWDEWVAQKEKEHNEKTPNKKFDRFKSVLNGKVKQCIDALNKALPEELQIPEAKFAPRGAKKRELPVDKMAEMARKAQLAIKEKEKKKVAK